MKLTLEVNIQEALQILSGLDIDEVAIKTTDTQVVDTTPVTVNDSESVAYVPTIVDEPGRKRKSSLQVAVDAKEEELNRSLTADELGELEFQLEKRKEEIAEAKRKAQQKDHVDNVAKEVQEAIKAEEEQPKQEAVVEEKKTEAKNDSSIMSYGTSTGVNPPGSTIPPAPDFGNIFNENYGSTQ